MILGTSLASFAGVNLLFLILLQSPAFNSSARAVTAGVFRARGAAVLAKLPPIFRYAILYNPRRDEIVAEPSCVNVTPTNAGEMKSHLTVDWSDWIPAPHVAATLPSLTDLKSGAETLAAFSLSLRILPDYRWYGFIERETEVGISRLPFAVGGCAEGSRSTFGVLTSAGVVPIKRWRGFEPEP